jgi:hypothetical protein
MLRPFLAAAALVVSAIGQPPPDIGRCPVSGVISMLPGRFRDSMSIDLLLLQDLGRIELGRQPGQPRLSSPLLRLTLVGLRGDHLDTLWTGPHFIGALPGVPVPVALAWAAGDVDRNGLDELLLLRADSCEVISFAGGARTVAGASIPGAQPEQALCCDLDGDSWDELVILERPPVESGPARPVLRVYQPLPPLFRSRSGALSCPGADSGLRFHLSGSARLDDYENEVAVVVGDNPELRPGLYAALYCATPDSFVVTTDPFPWQQWFSKSRVLPAGELRLVNVGDTLVAYGYFVPGSRPTGPPRSFAALQDGEWRLLPLTAAAARVSGPVCRYTFRSISGWLELRDDVFRFYPGDLFRWH